MNDKEIFHLQRLPARLHALHTAQLLGFQEHDIPILIRAKCLVPLGDPAPNGQKWFATAILLQLAGDPCWLNRATRCVAKAWQDRNRRAKQGKEANPVSN